MGSQQQAQQLLIQACCASRSAASCLRYDSTKQQYKAA
jgi:hypothetical protein